MLDLGFLPDVERILRKTPELRQTMLFSATMPSAVIALARTHMRHPLNIRAESHDETEMVPATAQFVYRAHDLDKPEVIARILQAEDRGRVMIFCRTKREASRLTDDLIDRGFAAAAIHGDLSQQARGAGAGARSAATRSTCWSRPTWPLAASTSRASRTSSTTPARRTRRPTSTGSAAPAGPAPPGIAVTFVDWARPDPLEGHQQRARPAVRRAAGDLLDLAGAVPRPRHPDRREGPDQAGPAGRGQAPAGAARGPAYRRGEGRRRAPGRQRNRSRRRTRAGEPVAEGTGPADASATATATTTSAATTVTAEGEAPARKPRQRNRRRRGGTAAVPADQAASPANSE